MFKLSPGVKSSIVALSVAALSAAGCGSKEESAMQKSAARFVAETREAAGHQVVVLRRLGEHPLEASLAPWAGANLFSLIYDGQELIYGPEDLASFTGANPGNPVLYPTPNRVAGGKFSFGGRTFDFGLNDGDRFLHGLVRSVPWQYEILPATDQGATVKTWIDFTPGSELYAKFGFEHRLTLVYTLDDSGLRIDYEVANRDSLRLPYGIAFHPYFRFLGSRESAILCVPAQKHHEAVNLMPTGKLEDLDGAPYDIRTPTPVPDLVLDDVYWGMRPENPAWIEYREARVRLELQASAQFTHMVVYIQPQNQFFCVENQTCSTDAHNLYARGLVEESHLLFAEPGGKNSGWVHYVISSF
ncbi:MAG: aldose 1-epimerase [Candidatus Glassbacteria bacterium]